MKKIFLTGIAQKSEGGKYKVLASTSAIDRQGDSIDQSGWDLRNFMQNPVILWAHDYSELPVGKAVDINVTENGLECEFEFASGDANPKAEQVQKLFDGGYLNAVSVGFIPRERKGNSITRSELLEISIVPVPANQEALRLAIDSKSVDVSAIKCDLEKGAVEDVLTQEEIMEQKYENIGEVYDIVRAFCEAYCAENVPVEDFSKLLTETVSILSRLASGEEVEPTEAETPITDAFFAKKFGFDIKEGRVISKKNRELISACSSKMQDTVAVLEGLLSATDSTDNGDGKSLADEEATEETVTLSATDVLNLAKHNLRATDKTTELTLGLINKFLAGKN